MDEKLAQKHKAQVDEYSAAYLESDDFKKLNGTEQEAARFTLSRLYGVGGSDVAPAMNLSGWKTEFQLWQEKTLRLEPDALQVSNPFVHWGHLMEGVIAEEYYNLIGHHFGEMKRSLTFHCDACPSLTCNIDAGIFKDGKLTRVVEIKTAVTNAYSGDYDSEGRAILSWGEGNRYIEDGDFFYHEDSQIPLAYRLQVEAYMLATGAEVADVVVLIGHHDMRVFTVHKNPQLQQKIIEKVNKFWDLVLTDTPPELVAADYEQSNPNEDLATINPEMTQVLTELVKLRAQQGLLSVQRTQLEDKLKIFIGDKAGLANDKGKVLVSWKKSPVKMKFDAQTFEKDNPQMYAQYMKPSKVTRTFLVKVK